MSEFLSKEEINSTVAAMTDAALAAFYASTPANKDALSAFTLERLRDAIDTEVRAIYNETQGFAPLGNPDELALAWVEKMKSDDGLSNEDIGDKEDCVDFHMEARPVFVEPILHSTFDAIMACFITDDERNFFDVKVETTPDNERITSAVIKSESHSATYWDYIEGFQERFVDIFSQIAIPGAVVLKSAQTDEVYSYHPQ